MMQAMLACPIDNYLGRVSIGALETYLTSPSWGAQEKADGHRVLIEVNNIDGERIVRVLNRSGEPRGHVVPKFITDTFQKVPFTAVFDGELVGTAPNQRLQLFDFPYAAHGDSIFCTVTTRYEERYSILSNFMYGWNPNSSIEVLPLAESEDAKRALLEWVDREGREGLVFKNLYDRYRPGARSLGVIKYKFRVDGDVIVLDKGVQGKDNLVLGAYEPGGTEPIEIGHCTALAGDGDSIQVGEVITVNYVHFSKGKRLVQPTLPRRRVMQDKAPQECTTDQFRVAFGK